MRQKRYRHRQCAHASFSSRKKRKKDDDDASTAADSPLRGIVEMDTAPKTMTTKAITTSMTKMTTIGKISYDDSLVFGRGSGGSGTVVFQGELKLYFKDTS